MGFAHKIDFDKVTQHEIDNTNKGLLLYKTIMDGRDNVPIIRDVFAKFYFKPDFSRKKIKDEDKFFERMSEKPKDPKKFASDFLADGYSTDLMLSFASKASHTYYPNNTPIFDSHVVDYLRLIEKVKMPYSDQLKQYDAIIDWYKKVLSKAEKGTDWVEWFNKTFTNYQTISDYKKIDTILYALSVASSKGVKKLRKDLGIDEPKLSGNENTNEKRIINKEINRQCRILTDIIYSNTLTSDEAILIINYYGINDEKGSLVERKKMTADKLNTIPSIMKKILKRFEELSK